MTACTLRVFGLEKRPGVRVSSLDDDTLTPWVEAPSANTKSTRAIGNAVMSSADQPYLWVEKVSLA